MLMLSGEYMRTRMSRNWSYKADFDLHFNATGADQHAVKLPGWMVVMARTRPSVAAMPVIALR